jgi:hypothetical protein
MGSVYDDGTYKCSFSPEDLGIDFFQGFSSRIVVTVTGGPTEMHVCNPAFLKSV